MKPKTVFFIFFGLFILIGLLSFFHQQSKNPIQDILVEPVEQISKILPKAKPSPENSEQLENEIKISLDKIGINIDKIRKVKDSEHKHLVIDVPTEVSLIRCNHLVTQTVRREEYSVLNCIEVPQKKQVKFRIGKNDSLHLKITLRKSEKAIKIVGRVAIIIDDFGYKSDSVVDKFLDFKKDLTYAIIPGITYSREIGLKASQKNKEVIIHLPFEPESNQNAETIQIKSGMTEEEIIWQIELARKSLPMAKGANNHQGSKATADPKIMSVVAEYFSENNMYFVDSVTSAESQAYEEMNSQNVKTAERNVFLDEVDTVEYVRGQMQLLASRAIEKGKAIGIGHVRKNTLEGIKSMIPEFEEQGIRFVKVTELLEN